MSELIQQTALWTPDAQLIPYDFCTCRSFIEGDMGNSQLPVAAPQLLGPSGILPTGSLGYRQPSEIVQAVAPFGRRIVQWAAQRMGGLPRMPHPDPQDANQILARYAVAFDCPKLEDDATNHLYRIGLTYVYFLLQPMWVLDNLNMGATPYDITPASINVFAASFFQYGLQTPGTIGGGIGGG